ncbi:hypothetical protein J4N02_01835 [Propioniciclava sp. MC1595]|uniref:sigma factor-like helix-turn-helix DNA-binding protein n=1 Tax=Propioniciclava sp. MC1595 TaxID=2760308 RepID=UPI0016625D07|nr:sigma factor-like helix-turn-helix DNA-binding protein [Propioniciclava sp. MC1595]MBB1495270.1 hypothetical protein [Propioniciclava sp. MC1595]QTE26394.1 hypothetical protein J4N02_01835 [Propioniciclava sp. MC1595]
MAGLKDSQRPVEVEAAWEMVNSTLLPAGAQRSANAVVSAYLQTIDPRHSAILVERMAGPVRRTLEELATDFHVTRERVRQLEGPADADIRHHLEHAEDWLPVRWAVQTLIRQAGSIAPLALLEGCVPKADRRVRNLIRWLAGYKQSAGMLIRDGFTLPSVKDLPRVDGNERVIDEYELIELLEGAGVLAEHVPLAIDQIAGLYRVDEQLVDWTGSLVDKTIAVLELRDEPQELDDLFDVVGKGSVRSFRQRVFEDKRLSRVTKTKLGLSSWGGTRYTTVVDLMVSRLQGGPRLISDLAQELEETYEVSTASVSMYCYAPIFKVSGYIVALRRADDPFVPRDKAEQVQGLCLLGESLIWHVPVDGDILRGSGRAIPHEIGTFLGLAPGNPGLLLRNPIAHIPVTWSEKTHVGPSIGSLQAQANALGAQVGDVLRLSFGERLGVDMSLVAPPRHAETPAERLSRLTGLPEADCADGDRVAEAIGVPKDQVFETLIKRGDELWAEAFQELIEG